ncbi:MAG: GlsB/YeaQ/YmgE family stress response membrane protein [Acidobacteria bacterium]|nr:GlsB/YeaQ/YmgE family stress response membrane protein [Acidobacteriota bacterium]
MGCFHVIWALVVGFFAGLVARWFVPGPHMGIIATTVLGIVGSLIGGFIAGLIFKPRNEKFHPAGFIFSVIGAIIALWLWHKFGFRIRY